MADRKEQAEALFKELLGQVAVLTDDEMFRKVYGFTMTEYLENRKEFAELCRAHAAHIEKVVKDTGIAKVTGGAVGIASGAAGLAGLFLAPFTAGLSLALTAGAVVGGVASAGSTLTAALVKDRNIKSDEEAIKEALAEFDKQEKVVTELLQKLNENFNQLHQLMDEDPSVLELIVSYASGVKNVAWDIVYQGVSSVKTINKVLVAGSFAKFIQADFEAVQGAATPGLRLFGKTLIAAGSTSAKLLSGALGVVGIGFGVYDVVEGSKDIKGSDLANTYTEFADTYSNDTAEITKQISQLENMTK